MKNTILLCKEENIEELISIKELPVEAKIKSEALNIDGFITEGESSWFSTGTQTIKREIQQQLNDPTVEEIFIKINTPGGEIAGVNELSDFIYEAKNIKPIIAYSNGMIASAGYWIASACSTIIIDETATVGSVGVVATVYDFSENLKKEEIKEIVITNNTSPSKRLDVLSEDFQKKILDEVNFLADIFFKKVARNRGVSVDVVERDFGGGGMLVSSEALRVGMVDEIDNNLEKKQESKKMGIFTKEELTMEVLNKDYPELVEQIKNNIEAQNSEAVIKAEHERQKQVMAVIGAETPACLFEKVEAKDLAFSITTDEEVRNKYAHFSNAKKLDERIEASKSAEFTSPIKNEIDKSKEEVEHAVSRQKQKIGV